MSSLRQGFTVALFLSFPPVCWGHGILRPYTSVAYYCPAPIQYVPVLTYNPYAICIPPPAPVYPLAPQPALPGRSYAPPTAAPPSAGPSTSEPPLASPPAPAKPSPVPPDRSLGFGETRSFYDAYSVASMDTAKPGGERCVVDFWNLTDGDLALRIEGGSPQVLPRGKSMRVVTGPRFTWKANGRPTQTTRVEEGESALQIVIRR